MRELWNVWAKEQPYPKPADLEPYDNLSDDEKERCQRVGSALWGDGFRDGIEFGLRMAAQLAEHGKTDAP